jgi:hypothetical protein
MTEKKSENFGDWINFLIKISLKDFRKTPYGFEGYGCGLCQTEVPCESKVPVRLEVDPF